MVVLGRKPGSAGGGGAPSGAAGGSLSGTYPNPGIANGAVDTAQLAADSVDSTIIDGADAAAIRTLLGVIASAVLFDSTLGGAAAAIDTGANGIAGGYNLLEVWIIARTTQVTDVSNVNVTVNNDTGNNYDRQTGRAAGTGITAASALAQPQWQMPAPGSNQHAGSAGVIRLSIPGYTQTTFHKEAEASVAVSDDTAGNNHRDMVGLRWRNTAAITRMAVTAASGNLEAGSRLLIYGR